MRVLILKLATHDTLQAPRWALTLTIMLGEMKGGEVGHSDGQGYKLFLQHLLICMWLARVCVCG